MNRKERRAAEHQARKAARKAGFPVPEPPQNAPLAEGIPEPGAPFPSLAALSPARMEANRQNAKRSTGAQSPETRAISAQNHTIHGLARHEQGHFKVLSSEDPQTFASLKQSLLDEHKPSTPTEIILVNAMAESHWLSERAQRLQDACINPDTGAVTDEKKFSLYLRYQTTHKRAFHKSLNDLIRLRADKRKAENGFEAQTIAKEKHEMKKQSHYWDVLKKDGSACNQLSLNIIQNIKARSENSGFEAEYAAELAKRGLSTDPTHLVAQVA